MSNLQDKIVASVKIPEIRSSVQMLFDAEERGEDVCSVRLTLTALISFYRKNLKSHNVDTQGNRLKGRLIENGVLYFGPMFVETGKIESKAKRLKTLEEAGFSTKQLAFLNGTQVDLFYTYVKETGLIHEPL